LHKILRPGIGDRIDIGCINGPRGKAKVVHSDKSGSWTLQAKWGETPPPPEPVDLIVGLPRPQTARKILNTATSMGFRTISFFQAEKGEPAYAKSKLWISGEWKRRCIEGAEQAFTTWLPHVAHFNSLESCLKQLLPPERDLALALDLYEARDSIRELAHWSRQVQLAVGPERGWSPRERNVLRSFHFSIASLGDRVLRTETACAVAMGCLLMGKTAN